jgi:uncharacterized protein (DUF1778 family)
MAPSARHVILLCCSKEESKRLHEQAHLDRRTVSAYVLNIIMKTVQLDEKLSFRLRSLARDHARRPNGPRTKVLLRCSREEANRIHRAARKRDTTVSAFVMQALRTSWQAGLRAKAEELPQREFRPGDQIRANLPGRIVVGTVRSVVGLGCNRQLEIEFGRNETARIWSWQVLVSTNVKHLKQI